MAGVAPPTRAKKELLPNPVPPDCRLAPVAAQTEPRTAQIRLVQGRMVVPTFALVPPGLHNPNPWMPWEVGSLNWIGKVAVTAPALVRYLRYYNYYLRT